MSQALQQNRQLRPAADQNRNAVIVVLPEYLLNGGKGDIGLRARIGSDPTVTSTMRNVVATTVTATYTMRIQRPALVRPIPTSFAIARSASGSMPPRWRVRCIVTGSS